MIWVAAFTHLAAIPTDKDVFGWKCHRPQGTKIVKLENLKDNHISQLWHSLEIFQRHVVSMLKITEE